MWALTVSLGKVSLDLVLPNDRKGQQSPLDYKSNEKKK